ncbi:hypothetical protein BYT27DRAFT_6711260 [Phlegmacium glaucopus]|nr:hypothetical protein BYT27DRAFT_6711260 [Phlegmacium glaucopus]
MRFSVAFAAIAVALSGVVASPSGLGDGDLDDILKFDLSLGNKYGAPHAPWESNSHPGWYYGDKPGKGDKFPCLRPKVCKHLKLYPNKLHCPPQYPPPPPPPTGYTQTFSNLDGATQASDYMTYGLVDTVADCQAMCDSVAGCKFVNTYHDVNGKDGSPKLTCSLFTACHTAADADNRGGQTQPDGSVDYITNSDGWCKN